MRTLLFVLLAAAAVGYALWVYRRVEVPVKGARWMAAARAVVLVMILALLFDPRVPGSGQAGVSGKWVVLDASLSMTVGAEADTPLTLARARAQELVRDGWTLVGMGGEVAGAGAEVVSMKSALTPVLERAAESGANDVIVLSDLRIDDVPAVRAALASLPLNVVFEDVGGVVTNAGIAAFRVPDAPRPGGTVVAEVEVHGHGNDNATVEVFADGVSVGEETLDLPTPGLRRTQSIEITVPEEGGRVRYTARVSAASDVFPSDDEAIAYASVGHREGALVLVSLSPNWEPRFLLPVLADVTGLAALGYLRVGPERFVAMGRAVDRGIPVDSGVVGRAIRDAELVVVHGLAADADAWAQAMLQRSGRLVVMPRDAGAAELVGLSTSPPRGGEWYASGDVPASPISGDLSGATLIGLPPLTDVLVPTTAPRVMSPLDVQFRGTGRPEAALYLDSESGGRRVVTLASGFWRWAIREGAGRDAYRRLWSGVAGWLLADDAAAGPEPRPTAWVVARGAPVTFSIPGDTAAFQLIVTRGDTVVADTVLSSGLAAVGALPPAAYGYRFETGEGVTVAEGGFDVAAATSELVATPADLTTAEPTTAAVVATDLGRPLRTLAWPYLLIILLLCGEWIVRRRSGLR